MRKILFLLALVFVLTSCWKTEVNNEASLNTKLTQEVKTMTWDLKTDISETNNIITEELEKTSLNDKDINSYSWIINNETQENISSWSVSDTIDYKIETENWEKVLYLIKNWNKIRIDSTTTYLGNVIFHKDFIAYVITHETSSPVTIVFDTVTMKKVTWLVSWQWSKDKNIMYSCIEDWMLSWTIWFFDFKSMKYIDLFKDFYEKDQSSSVTVCLFDDNKNEFNFSIKNSTWEKKYIYSVLYNKLNELNK